MMQRFRGMGGSARASQHTAFPVASRPAPVAAEHGTSPAKARGAAMRKIIYSVATSLDGYLAGPNGEADWIVMDPEIDFAGMMARFDTLLMGRRTFEAAQAQGGGGSMPGVSTVVVSRTLRQEDHPG